MPLFVYQCRDNAGNLKSGKRLANTSDALGDQLLKEGFTPISIQSSDDAESFWEKFKYKLFERPITQDDLGMFARQMSTLCATGVPLPHALKRLAESTKNNKMKNAFYGLIDDLESGQDLASAMQSYSDIFSPIMISMVRVGQSSGHLDAAFLRIDRYLELEGSAVKNLKTALRYPAFVLLAMIGAIVVINIFVIPSFANVFAQAKIQLPLSTRFFISMSNFFIHYGIALAVVITIAVIGFVYYIRTPAGGLRWDRWILQIPVFGIMLRRIILLRFSQSFSIALDSGIPLMEAIELVSQTVNNAYASSRIKLMQDAIAHGNTMVQAAATTTLFNPLELQMLSVSEETGKLSQVLEQIASFYRREVDYDLKRLNDVIEPLLIVVLSGVILILAFAVYMPIWDMAKVAKTA